MLFRKQKKLSLLLLIFFITIIAGAVYAVANGSLVYEKKITLVRDTTELTFTEHTQTYVLSSNGQGFGSYTIHDYGKKITFEVVLTEPQDSVTLYYNVVNTGTTNVVARNSTVSDPTYSRVFDISGSHISSSFGKLINSSVPVVIAPGATVEQCEITFTWNGFESFVGNRITLDIVFTLNYEATNLPATVLP